MDLISNTEGLRTDEVDFINSLGALDEANAEADAAVSAEAESIVNPVEDKEPAKSEDELDASTEEPDESSDDEEEEPTEDAIEYVETSDGKKVKIDYNDRDRVKRAHLLARQGRVWQAERDDLQRKLESIEPEYNEMKSVWATLEEVQDDIPELYRLITGGGDWEERIEQEIQQRDEIAQLTPAQLEVYNKHRIAEKREAELKKREEAWQRKVEEAEQAKQQAEADKQRSMINSVFNEHRFAGTLGDKAREHRLDKMVFNTIKSELNGKEVSQAEINELIKREFDLIRSSMSETTKQVKTKNHKNKVAQATKKAAENVNKSSNDLESLREQLSSGNIDGLFARDDWADLVDKL